MENEKNLAADLTERVKAFVKTDLVGLIVDEGECNFTFQIPSGKKLCVSVKEVTEK